MLIYGNQYCVKQRKKTLCVSNTERIVTLKNGQRAMICKFAECGKTKYDKYSFISAQAGKGLVDALDKLPGFGESRKYFGKIVPAVIKEPGAKEAFDDFGSGKTF